MGAVAPLDLDALLYRKGRELLGKRNGALITKLKKTMGSPAKALEVIEAAQGRDDPVAYVAAAANGRRGRSEEETERRMAAIREVMQ